MAKKTKFELRDFEFDRDLDFPDMDFDLPPMKDDRKPITKAFQGAKRGLKEGLKSNEFMRRLAKSALPDAYGQAMDLADQTAGNIREAYDNASKEMRPAMNELRRTAGRFIPQSEKYLPKNIHNALKKFADGLEDSNNKRIDARESALQATLGEVFQAQAVNQQKRDAEADARNRIREGIDQARHRDTLGQLDAIRTSIVQLTNFHTNIGSAYYRKSLEVQYRHYFVALDALEEAKKSNEVTKTLLDEIKKNTGLPDFVKLRGTERWKEVMRNEFIGSVQQGLFGGRQDFIKNVVSNLSKQALNKVKGVSQGLQQGLFGLQMGADVIGSMDGLIDPAEAAGEEGGRWAANQGAYALGRGLRGRVAKIPGVMKGNNWLRHRFSNAQQDGLNWAKRGFKRSDKEGRAEAFIKDAIDGNGFVGEAFDILRGAIRQTARTKTGIQRDNLRGLQEPAPFTAQARKSLTEIIPGYLARIYRELQVIRTGNTNIELTTYDYTSNKFSGASDAKKAAFAQIVSESRKRWNESDVKDALDEIDPDGKLSKEQREILARHMVRDNLNHGQSSAARMGDVSTYKGEASKHAETYAKVFRKHFANDKNLDKQVRWDELYGGLGRAIGGQQEMIQNLINAGQGDGLIEAGILDPTGQYINMDRLRDYYTHGEYNPSKEGVSGGVRKMGGPVGPGGFADFAAASPKAPFYQKNTRTVNINAQTNQLLEAVQESNIKDIATTMSETLLRIEERLEKGLMTMTANEVQQMPQADKRKWWNPRIGSVLGGLGRGARRIGSLAGKIGNFGVSGVMQGVRGLGKVTAMGGRGLIGAGRYALGLTGSRDVYVKGDGETPRLYGWKMRLGHYRNKDSGKIIRSAKDIEGTVEDVTTGDVVLEAQDAPKAFVKTDLGQKLLSGLGGALKLGGKLGSFAGGALMGGLKMIPPVIRFGIQGALGVKNLIWAGLNGPQDVYVVGQDPSKDDPKLSAMIMRNGGYFTKGSKEPVRKITDIKGPVEDVDGVVRLTHEDIQKGLIGRDGKPLKTGIGRLLHGVKNTIKKAFGVLGKIGRGVDNFLGAGWDMVKGLFGSIFGKESFLTLGTRRMVGWLEDIYHLLDERMPGKKVLGDADGDGIRDGSVVDLRRKRAAKEAAGRAGGASGNDAKQGGTLGLLARLFGRKKQEEQQEEKKGGLDLDVDLDGDGRKGKGRVKKGSRFDKMAAKKGWRGVLGKGLRAGGRGLGALGRGAGWLGRAALGLGGIGLGTLGAVGSAAASVGGTALGAAGTVGSAALGAGGWLLGAAGTALASLGAVISAPVVLGALAVGAVGAGLYFGYKALTKNQLDRLSAVRYAQYGFLSSETDYVDLIFGVEDKLKAAVVFNDGVPSIDGKKLKDPADLIKDFGFDPQDTRGLNAWLMWFGNRFKPVFLTHMGALNKIKPGASLREIGKLSTEQKRAYLAAVKFPDGPYNVMVAPLPSVEKLKAGPKEVQAAIEAAQAELDKEAKDNASIAAGETDPQAAARIGAVGAGATAAGAFVGTRMKVGKGFDQSLVNDLTKIDDTGVQNNRGLLYVQGSAAPLAGQVGNGRIDALAAIRYKTYGLTELTADKVRALAMLEAAVMKDTTFGSTKVAEWKGDITDLLGRVGAAFGVEGTRNPNAISWNVWFQTRFLPTFLNFATAVYRVSNKTDILTAADGLKPQQRLEVAQAVYSSTARRDGSTVSVWQITASPWPGYNLNQEVATTDGNVEGLKNAAKSDTLGEETAFERKASASNSFDDKSAAGSSNAASQSKSMFESIFGRSASGDDRGSGVAGFVSRAYNSAKSALGMETSGPGLGSPIQQPGNGTGGDINAVPMPKGDGSWAALKDTILGAAKMAGVDGKLMAVMAAIESGFRSTVKAGTSSATGLYQFIDGTWKTMIRKYGAKYGIDPNTPATDPRANALMGAEFLKENANALKGVKANLTDTDMYLAHFLGAGGAKKFLSADQNAIAAQVMPKEAAANKSIFYDQSGRPRTFAEVYAEINRRVRSAANTHKVSFDDGSEAIAATGSAPAASSSAAPASTTPQSASTADTINRATSAMPVADATPGVSGAAMAPPSSANTSPPPTPQQQAGTAAPAVDPVVASSSQGFGAGSKAAGIVAQQQAQARAMADSLGPAVGVLNQQLDVQKSILNEILNIGKLISMKSSGVGAGPSAADAAAAGQAKQTRAAPTPPVSMMKTQY